MRPSLDNARPHALLLDALGTLVALRPPAPALRAQLADRGVAISQSQAEGAIAAEISYYRTHIEEGRDAESLSRLRRRCAQVLRDALPRSERLAALGVDDVVEVLLGALRFETFPDVPAALSRARMHGWRIVVVSNWDVSLHGVLERLGLTAQLDGILTSAEVGKRKPAKDIFEQALALASRAAEVAIPAHAAIHVGDSIEEDVAGARAAGIMPILLARGGAPAPATSPPAGVRVPPAGVRVPPAGVRVISSLQELDLDP